MGGGGFVGEVCLGEVCVCVWGGRVCLLNELCVCVCLLKEHSLLAHICVCVSCCVLIVCLLLQIFF